ncbi:GTPase IMAP family member 9 [Amia ocellicauda]|uniref:GTPase IMAP family member 9 n=1 Tax=Amia ocellicauda TaxID=2972642 RepID=UPI0034638D4F
MSASVSEDLLLVVTGSEGSGKSATANTILNRQAFESKAGSSTVTQECQSESQVLSDGRRVTVVDTASSLHDPRGCLSQSQHGTRVFLLTVRVGRFTEGERQHIARLENQLGRHFYQDAIVLFTHGDDLEEGETIQQDIASNPHLCALVKKCRGRHHVFDNKCPTDRGQVDRLLEKVGEVVKNRGTAGISRQVISLSLGTGAAVLAVVLYYYQPTFVRWLWLRFVAQNGDHNPLR